jgi:hypothetical protein
MGRDDENAARSHRQFDKEPLELNDEKKNFGYDEFIKRYQIF